MPKYVKRNRLDFFMQQKPAASQADELVLRYSREELFNRHVVLPHAEVNENVYRTVDRFVNEYEGGPMTLTVHTDADLDSVQDIFREAYFAHYDDAYQKLVRYLRKRYFRIGELILVVIGAYWLGTYLRTHAGDHPYILDVISNLSAFCLWEIGYTHFDRSSAAQEMRRVKRARDANIVFMVRKK